MATKFVTNLDLNQNQILNATFEVLAADPTTNLFDGRMYFNSVDGVIKVYDATAAAWRKIVAGVGEAAGVVSGGSHSTALTITESGGQITITPNLATSASAGLLSASDFTKLGDSTSEATAGKPVVAALTDCLTSSPERAASTYPFVAACAGSVGVPNLA